MQQQPEKSKSVPKTEKVCQKLKRIKECAKKDNKSKSVPKTTEENNVPKNKPRFCALNALQQRNVVPTTNQQQNQKGFLGNIVRDTNVTSGVDTNVTSRVYTTVYRFLI